MGKREQKYKTLQQLKVLNANQGLKAIEAIIIPLDQSPAWRVVVLYYVI